jgi:hypothetical protein
VVAVALIALVGFMFWVAVDNDFETIWAAVGTIVGVLTGAIPSYFFKTQPDKASARAEAIASCARQCGGSRAPEGAPEAFR